MLHLMLGFMEASDAMHSINMNGQGIACSAANGRSALYQPRVSTATTFSKFGKKNNDRQLQLELKLLTLLSCTAPLLNNTTLFTMITEVMNTGKTKNTAHLHWTKWGKLHEALAAKVDPRQGLFISHRNVYFWGRQRDCRQSKQLCVHITGETIT